MKTILDRFDLLKTWMLITLGVGVFITGFGFGAVVADKTTPDAIHFCSKCGQSTSTGIKGVIIEAITMTIVFAWWMTITCVSVVINIFTRTPNIDDGEPERVDPMGH